ncbi:MAG: hypothetical protein AB8B69_09155 [Chitinophagales bacterium]
MPLKNYLFLIGGYDLEMLEIIQLLKKHKLQYIDKQLTWGAKLSDYQDFFDSQGTIVGIELVEDITCPKNYIALDHHNERAAEKAPIEQLAELIGIELTYYQQLVAANDKGYIPAMRALGATEEEVRLIRRRDRAAQGVTEEDEFWGEEAVANLQWSKNVAIAYTQSERFSPVTDRLEVAKLLVYNDHELTYYGANIQHLSEYYADLVKANKAYSGGGEMGFFGFSKKVFDKSELVLKIDEISTLV